MKIQAEVTLYDLASLRGEYDPETAPKAPYPLKFVKGTHWCSVSEVTDFLLEAGFVDLKYVQTLTRHPRYSDDQIEQPTEGYDKGDYIVIQGLLATSSLRSSQEALVSVLPCFWSYRDIALYHRDALGSNANKIYVDWASVYLSEDYAQLVEKLRRLVDRVCDDFPYERLKPPFLTASRYEYMYWDSVYNIESWPV